MIGFSQGGLLGRALIQNCPEVAAKVKNFISIGSPQNGVSEFPRCDRVIKGGPFFDDFVYPLGDTGYMTQRALVTIGNDS